MEKHNSWFSFLGRARRGVEKTELLDLLYQAEADGGFEVESADLSGYCSYCGHMMSKD